MEDKKYNNCIINNITPRTIPFENDNGFVELYNFNTGKSEILGRFIKNIGHEGILFQSMADDGKEYIINQENNKIIFKPDEPFEFLYFIDNDYVYYNGDTLVAYITDNASNKLKQYRISGTAVNGGTGVTSVGNKLFITTSQISYMIDKRRKPPSKQRKTKAPAPPWQRRSAKRRLTH